MNDPLHDLLHHLYKALFMLKMLVTNGTKYSRVDQVKFVERRLWTAFEKFEEIWSDHIW